MICGFGCLLTRMRDINASIQYLSINALWFVRGCVRLFVSRPKVITFPEGEIEILVYSHHLDVEVA